MRDFLLRAVDRLKGVELRSIYPIKRRRPEEVNQMDADQSFVVEQEFAAGAASAAPNGFMFQGPAGGPAVLPWQMVSPVHNNLKFEQDQRCFPSSLPPLPPPPPFYGGDLYSRRSAAAAGGFGLAADSLGLAGLYMGPESLLRGAGGLPSSPFSELGKLTPQEIMDAKALAASKSHSEAERRRRERINAHLSRLRSLLPSTTKTDKASLLAEVIQHVKELKRQTSEIAEESPLPTESDELTVDASSDDDGRLLVTASICCDDRSDLLPELIKALKALRLRTLKAEITTLGGRVKNVLVIASDDQQQCSVASIQDALKAVMDRTAASDEPAAIKRQRTANLSSMI